MRHILIPFMFLPLVTVPCSAQDIEVHGIILDRSSRLPLAGSMVTLEDNSLGPEYRFVCGDHGEYVLNLQLEQRYTLRYSASGYLPKQLVIDTRNVDASLLERLFGWGMEIDVTLDRPFEGLDTALLKIPFGYAAWNSAEGVFQWDTLHTEKVRKQWAALLPFTDDGEAQGSEQTPRVPDSPLGLGHIALTIALILVGRWGIGLLYRRIAERVSWRERLLVAVSGASVAFASFVWLLWSGAGSEHVLAFVAAFTSVGLELAALLHSGPVLDHRTSDGPIRTGLPIVPEDRAGGRMILGRMIWVSYLLVIIGGLLVFQFKD